MKLPLTVENFPKFFTDEVLLAELEGERASLNAKYWRLVKLEKYCKKFAAKLQKEMFEPEDDQARRELMEREEFARARSREAKRRRRVVVMRLKEIKRDIARVGETALTEVERRKAREQAPQHRCILGLGGD